MTVAAHANATPQGVRLAVWADGFENPSPALRCTLDAQLARCAVQGGIVRVALLPNGALRAHHCGNAGAVLFGHAARTAHRGHAALTNAAAEVLERFMAEETERTFAWCPDLVALGQATLERLVADGW